MIEIIIIKNKTGSYIFFNKLQFYNDENDFGGNGESLN